MDTHRTISTPNTWNDQWSLSSVHCFADCEWASTLTLHLHPNCCRQYIFPALETTSRGRPSAISKRFGEFCDTAIGHQVHCICLLPKRWMTEDEHMISGMNAFRFPMTRLVLTLRAELSPKLRRTSSKINCFSSKCLSSFRDSRCGRWWWPVLELFGLVIDPVVDSLFG